MNWGKISEKVVIHIADAPGHGYSFNKGRYSIPRICDDPDESKKEYENMDYDHDAKFPEYIEKAARKGIRFFCLAGGNYPVNSFMRTKEIYKEANGKQFNITRLDDYGEDISDDQKEYILKVVKEVALKSVDSAVAVNKSNDDDNDDNDDRPINHLGRGGNKNSNKNQKNENFGTRGKKQKQAPLAGIPPEMIQPSGNKKSRKKKKADQEITQIPPEMIRPRQQPPPTNNNKGKTGKKFVNPSVYFGDEEED